MTNPSVRDLVDRALLPLRAVDGALHDRAVDYVVDGAHPQVLGEIASFGEAPDECLRPACPDFLVDNAWRSRLRRLGIVRNAAGRESWPILELRSPLYRSGAPSASQWARLGRLLDAVHRTAASPRLITPGAVPAWLDVLLADVLCIPGVWYRSAQTAEIAKVAEIAEIVEARPGWDADRVVELLAEDGTGEPDRLLRRRRPQALLLPARALLPPAGGPARHDRLPRQPRGRAARLPDGRPRHT